MPGRAAALLAALGLTAGHGAHATAQVSAASAPALNAAADAPSKTLKAWANFQPFDAWLGSLIVERFAIGPKVPLVQGGGALDPCPLLSEWPDQVVVDAPNPCKGLIEHSGNWTATGGNAGVSGPASIMGWSVSCSPVGPGLVPVMTYTLPSGGLFGTSAPVASLAGNSHMLRDCTGYVKYQVDEKVYHVPGKADRSACEDFGSCDGIVYVQYFIRDWAGRPVAQTPYLRLFQNRFTIEDTQGKKIAEVKRVGRWSPMSQKCVRNSQRQWMIRFADPQQPGNSGTFARPGDRWPVAELVSIMAHRDADRRSSGLVAPSACEVEKSGLLVFILSFAAAVVIGGVLLCLRMGVVPLQAFFIELEQSICPRRMAKPSRPGWI